MAVASNPQNSRFSIVRELGIDGEGNPLLHRKSYSNVKWDAADQDVYDVASALAGLSQFPLIRIDRYDNEFLTNI